METYLIGLCDRAHEVIPTFITISISLSIVLGVLYGGKISFLTEKLASDFDYKFFKVCKIVLIVCAVVLVLSLLLLIFIPTGEEVSLMMQTN